MNRPAAQRLSNREIVSRIVEILNSGDFDALAEYLAPDSVQEIPQSGERIRGSSNQIATLRNYPGSGGSIASSAPRILSEESRYVISPTFSLLRVEGSGDTLTVATKARYPDGSDWYVLLVITFRDGLVSKMVQFFAPTFPAPEWRRPWAEMMEDGVV
jgi:hypothetical protein